MNDLARALGYLKQYDEAEAMLRQATASIMKTGGAEDPDIIRTMDHLGRILAKLQKYDEAEVIYQKVLELSIKVHDGELVERLL
jgi:tetratricopeptide (TPR) repeat protein